MTRDMNRPRAEEGFVGVMTVLLVAAVVTVSAAVYGLNRTASLATQIDDRSESISTAAGGINLATKAILRLDETNSLGDSIEATAEPLKGQLDEIIRIAGSIDGLASSINGTANAINSSASGINGQASAILGIGRSINNGVATINQFVMTTIELADAIRRDTENIVGQARTAMKLGACIDRGLQLGGVSHSAPDDGHCR